MMGSGHTVVVCMHCGMTMNRRMYRVLPTIGHGLCVTPSRDHGSNAIEHMVASTWESNVLLDVPRERKSTGAKIFTKVLRGRSLRTRCC